jgi:RHS repeat-associated protein
MGIYGHGGRANLEQLNVGRVSLSCKRRLDSTTHFERGRGPGLGVRILAVLLTALLAAPESLAMGIEARKAVDSILTRLTRTNRPQKKRAVPATSAQAVGDPGQQAAKVRFVRLCPRSLTMYVPETYTLVPLPLDLNRQPVTAPAMTWQTDNAKVAVVTSSGEVDAIAPGNARIRLQIGKVNVIVSVEVRSGARIKQTDADWDKEHGHDCDSPESIGLFSPEPPEPRNSSSLVAGGFGESPRDDGSAGPAESAQRTQPTAQAGPAKAEGDRSALRPEKSGLAHPGTLARPAAFHRSPRDAERGVSVRAGKGRSAAIRSTASGAMFQGGNPDLFPQAFWLGNAIGSPRLAPVEQSKASSSGTKNHLVSGNYNFTAPVLSVPGRNTSLSLALSYNGQLWGKDTSGSPTMMMFDYGTPGVVPGWVMNFGRIIPNFDNTASGGSPGNYLVIMPDGTRVPFLQNFDSISGTWSLLSGDGLNTFLNPNQLRMRYADGTVATYQETNNKKQLASIETPNGDKTVIGYRQPAFFGNRYAVSSVTDTKGRSIVFHYYGDSDYLPDGTPATPEGALAAISGPDLGGGTRTFIRIDYQNVTLNYNFNANYQVTAPPTNTPIVAVKRIYYPATGRGYLFVNNSTTASLNFSSYGMCRYISVRNNMTGPSPGFAMTDGTEVAYTQYDFDDISTDMGAPRNQPPTYTNRSEWWQGKIDGTAPTVYQYSRTSNPQVSEVDTVTEPVSGLQTVTTSLNGGAFFGGSTTTEYKQGSTTLRKVQQLQDGCPHLDGSPCDPRNVVGVNITDDASNVATTSYSYDKYNRMVEKDEYGFGTSIARKTTYTYLDDSAHIALNMVHLVTRIKVFDGQGHLASRTDFTYDDYNAKGGMETHGLTPPYPVPHDAMYDENNTVRGNVTGVTTYSDATTSVTRNSKYDIFGNVTNADVACCQVKTFAFSGATAYCQPDSITDGVVGTSPYLTTTYSYDFDTGLVQFVTDPDKTPATGYTYDTAWRPLTVVAPTGAQTTTQIGKDADQINDQLFATSQVSYTDADGTAKVITTKNWLDGAGRIIETGTGAGATPSGFDAVQMTYDQIGRLSTQSNPYSADSNGVGTPTSFTTNVYDTLSRVTTVMLPDTPSQSVSTAYNGAVTTVTDQVGRKRQSQVDGLGRLVTVTEQDPTTQTGTLTLPTMYTYDALDNLTGVNQGNQLRSFTYDFLSRMLTEMTPEGGTTNYTYTTLDAVQTRTDPRNAVTTYHYDDALNRLTSVTYALPAGVAATPNLTFHYNTSNPGNGHVRDLADGAGTETYIYDNLGRLTSKTRAIDGNSYQTQYQYNQINQLALTIYPSLKRIRPDHDLRGRWSGVDKVDTNGAVLTGYASVPSTGYDTAGHLTALSLGNTLSEGYTFSSDRLQLTGQNVKKGQTTLMSLTYSYQAAAGASGAGTTAGNSGQLMAVSAGSTVNGLARDQAFTYDNMARLKTATGWGTWQRRYDLDRWGNRTAEWDSVTGGNQIQTITLQTPGGVTNNRITSVSGLGAGSYTYDATGAGYLINDGTHSYQYDGEGRLANVDAGLASEVDYSYDASNWRVKKVTGAGPGGNPVPTYYIWDAGRVIAEYSTAPTPAPGGLKYYHPDRLSTRMTTDPSGNVISTQDQYPFGEDAGSTGTAEKHRFTNYERDAETGTDYALNRQYSNALGRMHQPDRAGGSASDPQSLNRYAYGLGDPVNISDPGGNDGYGIDPNWDKVGPLAPGYLPPYFGGGAYWDGIYVQPGLMWTLGPGEGLAQVPFGTLQAFQNAAGGYRYQYYTDKNSHSSLDTYVNGGEVVVTGLGVTETTYWVEVQEPYQSQTSRWILPQPTTRQDVINEIFKIALGILRDRPPCAQLLAGTGSAKDPWNYLSGIKYAGKIKEGALERNLNAQTYTGALAAMGLAYPTITLNSNRFFTDPNAIGVSGLSTAQTQVLVLLHELGHATGAKAADHYSGFWRKEDYRKEEAYNQAIYEKCLGR